MKWAITLTRWWVAENCSKQYTKVNKTHSHMHGALKQMLLSVCLIAEAMTNGVSIGMHSAVRENAASGRCPKIPLPLGTSIGTKTLQIVARIRFVASLLEIELRVVWKRRQQADVGSNETVPCYSLYLLVARPLRVIRSPSLNSLHQSLRGILDLFSGPGSGTARLCVSAGRFLL